MAKSFEQVLDQEKNELTEALIVHCRIGSLENPKHFASSGSKVHCRIGSLER